MSTRLVVDPDCPSSPISKKEAKDSGSIFYFTGKACRNGHIARRRLADGRCILCEREKGRRKTKNIYADPIRKAKIQELGKAYKKAIRKKNNTYAQNQRQHKKDLYHRLKRTDPEWYQKEMARKRELARRKYKEDAEWREMENARCRRYLREYRATDGYKAWQQSYNERNPGYVNEKSARRRAQAAKATPKWLTDEHIQEMKDVYALALLLSQEKGEPYEVDHIAPLISKKVCGLHVPWNLRVIPRKQNQKKGNRF